MEYITSNKGAVKLIYEKHIYVKQKELKNGAVCWECNQRRYDKACKAKLHILDDVVIKRVNEHTHAENHGMVEAVKLRQQIKKHARETQEAPQQIIRHC